MSWLQQEQQRREKEEDSKEQARLQAEQEKLKQQFAEEKEAEKAKRVAESGVSVISSACLSLSVCLSVRPYVCLSVHMSACPSICLPVPLLASLQSPTTRPALFTYACKTNLLSDFGHQLIVRTSQVQPTSLLVMFISAVTPASGAVNA